MPSPRHLLVDPTTSGVFHCVSRCVRRAFLCGKDEYSGRDYEHRRAWVEDRLRQLAGLFAIEVHAFAVMANHVHVVVRTLPGAARTWQNDEVARRWLTLFPGKNGRRLVKERCAVPDPSAVADLCRDREKLEECRARLGDLSWFMRCLNEPIARRANREDECTGRFWEGRFKCQKLDDEGAILACMAYVDLNPIRAGTASTPESSLFTSVRMRVHAHRARRRLSLSPESPTPEQAPLIRQAESETVLDSWLAPIGTAATRGDNAGEAASSAPGERHRGGGRPDEELAPLLTHVDLEQYLLLLDWTGREVRRGKRGHIPAGLKPVLERIDLDVDAWVDNVECYGSLFHRIAGKLRRLREAAEAAGLAWVCGQSGARRLYSHAA